MSGDVPPAALVAALLAIDPKGLGGVWLRARHGPMRDVISNHLEAIPGTHGRVMPESGETDLFGGMDLSESLIRGRLIERRGVLSSRDVLWLTRAERLPVRLAAQIARELDAGMSGAIVLCDESAEADEAPPTVLRDRLAFFLCDKADCSAEPAFSEEEIRNAHHRIASVTVDDHHLRLATWIAAELGCRGSRPALFVIRAARALAALSGGVCVDKDHLRQSAALTLPHRMRMAPETAQEQPEVESRPEQGEREGSEHLEDLLHDIVLDAARVNLPVGLLAGLIARDRHGAGSGRGAERLSKLRGRPLPSRAGAPDGRTRLDVLATLQAAAPWQKLRANPQDRLAIRPSDLRVRRYRERSERMLLFVVDASGSAAMARLAEAKGAAEAILSEAYRSRDHVSLITFRGDQADCALEATRSLVRAKRLLGGLPGGGATPLADALRKCAEQAAQARRRGLTPHVILMTDGRANKALDGSVDKAQARADALKMARLLAGSGVHVLVVDSGLRPNSDLDEIAQTLKARTVRLPRGQRNQVSAELLDALDA